MKTLLYFEEYESDLEILAPDKEENIEEQNKLLKKAIEDNHLERDVTLAGSFCTGRCNRNGVTITVDDDVYPGVTKEGFRDFFQEKVLAKLK